MKSVPETPSVAVTGFRVIDAGGIMDISRVAKAHGMRAEFFSLEKGDRLQRSCRSFDRYRGARYRGLLPPANIRQPSGLNFTAGDYITVAKPRKAKLKAGHLRSRY